MKLRWKLVVLAALVALTSAQVLRWGWRMQPVRRGTAADFWYAACDVELDGREPRPRGMFGGRVYPARDGWFLYGQPHFHGEDLYPVPEEEVLAAFPEVREQLDRPRENVPPFIEAGIRNWAARDPGREDAAALLEEIRSAWLGPPGRGDEQSRDYRLALEQYTEQRRLEAWKWWWVTIPFEVVFLTGLLLFAAWPWLIKAGKWRWSLHLGLLPPLFFAPYLLGYAPLTFTSAFPQGGAFYPHLLIQFRGLPRTPIDRAVLPHIPRPLARLSPGPGPVLSISGFGAAPPSMIALMSAALSLLPWLPGWYLRAERRLGLAPRGSSPLRKEGTVTPPGPAAAG
jgi:hypothetical protein